ncbi:MAG: glycosyltransferase 87 family protein, partial [Thermoleophilaceae bacterium]
MELRLERAGAALLKPAAVLVLLLALPAPAAAQQVTLPTTPANRAPHGYRLAPNRAIAIANTNPKVIAERRKRGALRPVAYLKPGNEWQVSYFQGQKERAQVTIFDPNGAVVEAWAGYQVPWKMARGYPGAFGRKLNAPYVWLPLCALFLLPFIDFRRPFRLLHLDLAVLLLFGVSHIFFNDARIDISVPLVYPVLVYLLVRMLIAGFRPRGRPGRLVPHVRVAWMAMALLFLVGFRIALNVVDSNVIDVGYAGVIGGSRIIHGHGLYNGAFPKDNEHGDTYGPVNYLAYVPFVRAFGWSGRWDPDMPAAHGAAIAFDLLTMLGLLVLGRRARPGPGGTGLGIVMAYAWAAYPYTLFAMESNSNDAIVSMFVVWALVATQGTRATARVLAPVRGALIGLAAAAKFAPAALAPLFARGEGRWRTWHVLAGLAGFAVVIVAAFAPFIPAHGGVRELYDRTVGYQASRASPFSVWGLYPALHWLQTVAKVLA